MGGYLLTPSYQPYSVTGVLQTFPYITLHICNICIIEHCVTYIWTLRCYITQTAALIWTLQHYITLQRFIYGHYNGVSVRVSVATLQVWWQSRIQAHISTMNMCVNCSYTLVASLIQLCRSLFFVGALFAQVHAQDLHTCILRPSSLCLCF